MSSYLALIDLKLISKTKIDKKLRANFIEPKITQN